MGKDALPFINDNKVYKSYLDIFFPEFLNPEYIIIDMGFVEQSPVNIPPDKIIKLRTKLAENVNENTKVVFDGVCEGIVVPIIDTIHSVIRDIVKPENVYFIHGAMNGDQLYNEYLGHAETRINIITVTFWEHDTKTWTNFSEDIKYVVGEKEKVFVCFNRIARSQRLALFALCIEHGLLDKSFYSYLNGYYTKDAAISFYELEQHLSTELLQRIKSIINTNRELIPYKLNTEPDENTIHVRNVDVGYFANSYFSLVTETVFFPLNYRSISTPEKAIFFSEKIFKPIRMKHPFILLGAAGSLNQLRRLGYRTYGTIIDERYDNIENHEDRLLAVFNEVLRLSHNTPEQWIEWQNSAKEIAEHNYNVMQSKTIKDFIIK